MPDDRITLDDALTPQPQGASGRITFDDALSRMETRSLYPTGASPDAIAAGTQQPYAVIPAPGAIAKAQDANFGAALKTNLVEDEATKVRLVAESLGIDPARVGIVNGKPVFVNERGQLQYVSGPISRGSSALVANAPEMILGGVGSLAGSPVVGGTAGVVGARGIKRALSGLMFDEPQTVSGNLQDLAVEGAIAAGSAGLGKGLVAASGRGKIVDFTPSQIRTAEQARQHIKARTGIDLDLAQASGDRKLLALRDYAARYPGKSAEIIQAADEVAQGQFDAATNRVLNLVRAAQPAEVSGQNAVNAAQAVIGAARRSVSDEVRPLYEAAYAAKPEVTNPRLLSMLKLPHFDAAFKTGQRIAKLEGGALKPGEPPDLRALDLTKQGLDDKIETLKAGGQRSEARALKAKRDEFVAFLDNVTDDKYQVARQTYATLMESRVAPLENGTIGVLAKLHPKNAQLAARVLSDPGVTAEQIAILKGGLSRSNPDAYRGLVRQWLGAKYNQAMKQTQGGDTINPAGKFRQAVMGTPGDAAKARAMLPADALDAFDDLMLAAEKLARTPLGASRVAGSNTARDQLITEQLKGRALATMRWLIAPRQSLQNSAEQRVLESGVNELTEALIDPLKRAQLKQIVRMQPSTAQAIKLGAFLGGQSVKVAVDDLGENRMPAALFIPVKPIQHD